MTLYRLWIICLQTKNVIYTRHFPHLESMDDFTFPKVTPEEFVQTLFSSIGLKLEKSSNVLDRKDSILSVNTVSSNNLRNQIKSTSSSSLASSFSTVSRHTSASYDNESSTHEHSVDGSLMLQNSLPLIVCKFIKHVAIEAFYHAEIDRQHQIAVITLIMLIHEQNGYLFVGCPRITSLDNNIKSMVLDFENLLLDEHNISLAYTALHLFASYFFKASKSILALEYFFLTCLPMGTLINQNIQHTLSQVKVSSKATNKSSLSSQKQCIKVSVNEMMSSSFKSVLDPKSSKTETIFGKFLFDSSSVDTSDLVRPKLMFVIDNLNSFMIFKPFACDMTQSSLIVDLTAPGSCDKEMVIHYRAKSASEEDITLKQDSRATPYDCKMFSYQYTIFKKVSSDTRNRRQSFIDSSNVNTVLIELSFPPTFSYEDVKFTYFNVKFSNSSNTKSVEGSQTLHSSFSNLIIRESIKVSQGQFLNENKSFVWALGQKISKSGKATLEFDILIDQNELEKLDVQSIFEFKYKISIKMAENKNANSKECSLRYPFNTVKPKIKLVDIKLLHDGQFNSNIKKSAVPEQLVLDYEYKLVSFEYKMFPNSSK